MEIITQILDSAWIQALGWTLVHSLWQGVILALFLAMVLLILKKQNANIRYLAGIFTLCSFIMVMAITFNLMYEPYAVAETPEAYFEFSGEEIATVEEVQMSESFSHEINGAESSSLLTYFREYFQEHLPIIFFFYLIGVLILTMRMLGELVYIQTLRHSRSHTASKHWQEKIRGLASMAGIDKLVEIRESLHINTPMIAGIFKPVIFVPLGMLSNLPAAQVESVLAHELAHIRRHDYLINLLQSFIEIILFFNPAIWWISSFIRSEREHCCDDIAIELTGDELSFVKALASLEDWRAQHTSLALAFSGQRKGGVLRRVQRLVNHDTSIQLPFRLFWGTAILLLGITLSAFSIDAPPSNLSEQEYGMIENVIADTIPETKTETVKIVQPDFPAAIAGIRLEGKVATTFPSSSTPVVLAGTVSGSPSPIVGLATTKNLDNQNPAPVGIAATPKPSSIYSEQTISIRPALADSVPEHIKKMEAEMKALQKQYEPKMRAIKKQRQELEFKKHEIVVKSEEKMAIAQMTQAKVEYELKKAEAEASLKQRETEIIMYEKQRAIMELEHQARELELQRDIKETKLTDQNEAQIKKELEALNKREQQFERQKLDLVQEIEREEMDLRKAELQREKEMQEKLNSTELKQHELQMQEQEAHLKVMKLEDEARQLELKMMKLESQFEMEAHKLANKIEEAYRKYQKEEH